MNEHCTDRPPPNSEWLLRQPADVDMAGDELLRLEQQLRTQAGEAPFRVVIVRRGAVVAEWNHRMDAATRLGIASAAKSVFSCILGIAIHEGKIQGPDARLVDICPETMDVPPGEGPKEGRHAFPKNRGITLRHLISNTSGYMKPGEDPGKVFHYQTYGMNVLTHAIAKAYGLYDWRDPENSPGLAPLVDRMLKQPLGATWTYSKNNFRLHDRARLGIFGYYDAINANALDLARLGWLWCNSGSWEGRQLVPEDWMRHATKVAPDIEANCPREDWRYGHGFWTNDRSQLWPDLPRDAFAASGAGKKHVWVCPSRELVVAHCPGIFDDQCGLGRDVLPRVLAACR